LPETTISDGIIEFEQPSDFGLATTPEQILVSAYIPPCDSGFKYCLYYHGNEYKNTNFESAGLSIRTRDNFSKQEQCLTTPPEGYANMTPSVAREYPTYAVSAFSPLGDAAVGHYTTGEEYRIFVRDTCYQLDVRVGETQFQNYPEGSIEEFTKSNRTAMLSRLRTVAQNILLVEEHGTVPLVLPRP